MNQSRDNRLSGLYQRTKKRALQRGVTLQEVLIGIAIAAVIAASSIFLGARFIGQGQFASARQTLLTAQLTTEQVYATIIEGGGRNYIGAKPGSAETNLTLSGKAATALNALGEDVNFVPLVGGTTTCSAANMCAKDDSEVSAALKRLGERDVWIEVLPDTSGVLPQDAQAVRLGMKAGDGSTLCVVIVKQASDSDALGKTYQTVKAQSAYELTSSAVCDIGKAATTDNLKSPGTSTSGDKTYKTSIIDPT